MTLMEIGNKVCSMLGIDPEEIIEMAYVQRKLFNSNNLKVKGCVLLTETKYIIVPDLRDAERIYQYDKRKKADIIKDLMFRGMPQAEIAILLRCSQSTVSRILSGRKW